jgi:hypothetical protein
MIDCDIEDEEAVSRQMDDLAGRGKLPDLVDRYSETDQPNIARALAHTLIYATAYMRGPDLAPLILETMRRLKTDDEKARAQLICAMQQSAARGELFASRYPREPAVSVFLEDALARGPTVQKVAVAALGWLWREGVLQKFPAERLAALRTKLRPLEKSPVEEIRLELEAMQEFLSPG